MSDQKWVLITGANGFVAHHLIQVYLQQEDVQIMGVGRSIPKVSMMKDPRFHYRVADLTSPHELNLIFQMHEWKEIYHLAGENRASGDQKNVWRDNVYASLLLLDKLRDSCYESLESVVMMGTAMEYQAQKDLISESSTVEPSSLYGWSKHLVTKSAQWFAGHYNLPVICIRPFNLIGPGSKEGIMPWIAHQLKEQYPFQEDRATIRLRSLGGVRDYVDIRDAVQALYLLSKKAKDYTGDCYQICSQKGVSIPDVISTWEQVIQHPIEVVAENPTSPSSMEEDCFIGSYQKIKQVTGWVPTRKLQDTLQDLWEDVILNGNERK